MTTYLASAGPVSKHKAGWLQGFDVFNGLRQQLSAITETNSKAIADVTARVANQANAHSKKSA